MKNILILCISLVGIMLASTAIVLTFNSLFGFSTDVNTNDVSTSIAAIAFLIAVICRNKNACSHLLAQALFLPKKVMF